MVFFIKISVNNYFWGFGKKDRIVSVEFMNMIFIRAELELLFFNPF